MYRNQYDHDVSIWSPQGRIFQIEYAMEAVKQGSATVGLKSKDYAVLVALKRSSSELSSYQKKIISVDDHVAVSIAGLTSDGRLLSNFMRDECLNSRYVFESALPVSRLVSATAEKMQKPTKVYGRRPFGVGILVAGYDSQGAHIYQLCPSANYFNCKAMSIGARSQSARTCLERNFDKFENSSYEEIIAHGLRSLRECLPNEQELNVKNCTIAVVGKDKKLTLLDNDDVAPFLALIDQSKDRKKGGEGASEEGMEQETPDTQQSTTPSGEEQQMET
ncbi:proteasome subunit alpha type-1-like [Hydractinia symbiolongicarpus]|uniref:proteasome subunit alpha type-1-like n=1 Tax=Hydractinia symbiolongicarpus TaxID=13093 RepID=UPI002551156A|nr:proteasome subunit alpha type-1-like [Hydractinia symbiolongicarpus]